MSLSWAAAVCMLLKPLALLSLSVNAAVIATAALRGMAYDQRERAFWRAYDARCISDIRAKFSTKGHCR
jgi:predicted membrane metal-binding protein